MLLISFYTKICQMSSNFVKIWQFICKCLNLTHYPTIYNVIRHEFPDKKKTTKKQSLLKLCQ
nr:MAG TPA: hypothetical protein [Caudoviricetes sp.]